MQNLHPIFPKSGRANTEFLSSSIAFVVGRACVGGGDGISCDNALKARSAEKRSSNKTLQDSSPSHSIYDGP
jgi:hypothetical protein